jgi:hypothetical protein
MKALETRRRELAAEARQVHINFRLDNILKPFCIQRDLSLVRCFYHPREEKRIALYELIIVRLALEASIIQGPRRLKSASPNFLSASTIVQLLPGRLLKIENFTKICESYSGEAALRRRMLHVSLVANYLLGLTCCGGGEVPFPNKFQKRTHENEEKQLLLECLYQRFSKGPRAWRLHLLCSAGPVWVPVKLQRALFPFSLSPPETEATVFQGRKRAPLSLWTPCPVCGG